MTAHVLRISEDNSIEFWSGFDRQMNFLQPIPETCPNEPEINVQPQTFPAHAEANRSEDFQIKTGVVQSVPSLCILQSSERTADYEVWSEYHYNPHLPHRVRPLLAKFQEKGGGLPKIKGIRSDEGFPDAFVRDVEYEKDESSPEDVIFWPLVLCAGTELAGAQCARVTCVNQRGYGRHASGEHQARLLCEQVFSMQKSRGKAPYIAYEAWFRVRRDMEELALDRFGMDRHDALVRRVIPALWRGIGSYRKQTPTLPINSRVLVLTQRGKDIPDI
ncbi:hypothetical protein B0H13DRAFT_1856177 [Mycena leptocephala]|nr:hypothetical protein B0H13DRAFT_1856177 [Mycena leptocephala]